MRYVAEMREGGKFDVVVCGGGCAGVVAAIAAARNGARTSLVEKSFSLGGTAYNAMVGPFMTCFDRRAERQLIKGIFDEMIIRMEKRGGAIHPSKTGNLNLYGCYIPHNHNNVTPFEAEAFKFVCFEMLGEAGVRLFLNHTLLDAETADGAVTAAVCFDGNGLVRMPGTVFIDCTGDGILSAKAGVEWTAGDAASGKTQPMTLFFSIYDVDDEKLKAHLEKVPLDMRHYPFNAEIEALRAQGKFPVNRNKIGLYKMVKPGQYRLNTTRIQDLDPLDPDALSKAYVEGMKQIDFLMNFFKTLPGLENAKLLQTAASIGVRDSRRIKGVYTMTADDIFDQTQFPDCIAYCAYPIDLHPQAGAKTGILDEDRPAPNEYQIPYRILVPEKVNSLLVAGRCASATFEAMGAVRVMPPVMAMAHAAGIAAAMSAKAGKQPRDVDVAKLRAELAKEGAVV